MRFGSAKRMLLVAVAGIVIGGTVMADATKQRADRERVIKIVAQRYSYAPNEILLKQGQTVVLEFTSLDFVHGLKIPDLDVRVDLPPGKVTRVRITPEKAGVYDFLCDNFCGSGHEDMGGRIIARD